MYNGPNGPWSALVHVAVRRPIVSVAIAVLGLGATVNIVTRTPGGPGIHGGSDSVLRRVEERLAKDDPRFVQLFPIYEEAYLIARKKRGDKEMPDRVIKDILEQFGSGLTVRDVRKNEKLLETVEKAYFFDSIHRYNGKVDLATAVYQNVH